MSNKQIRRQAQSICIKNMWRFLLVETLVLLPSCLNLLVNNFAEQLPKNVITLFVSIIAYPLMLGATAYFYKEFHGQRCSLRAIVQFYCDKKLLFNACCLGTIVQIIYFFPTHLTPLFRTWGKLYPLMIVLVQIIPTILVSIAQFVLLFRFFLVPYIFVDNPMAKPARVVGESMRKTKGYIFDQIVFVISIGWIPALLLIFFASLLSGTGLFRLQIWGRIITLLLMLPFMPYVQLCLSGFAARLLPENWKKTLKIANSKSKWDQKYRYKTDWFE